MKHLAIILGLLSTYIISFSQIPTDGLVAYYPFNGNANDESGNGNDGIVNGATLTEDRYGDNNKAYVFDGVNDYIICDSALSVLNLEELTISVWINYFGHAGYESDVVLSTLESNGSGGYQIHLENWERKIMFVYRDGNLPHHYTKDTTIIETNKWYHFVSVLKYVDSVLTGYVYLNGELENTVIQHDNIYYGLTKNLWIGSNYGIFDSVPYERCFKGKIDNIRIYNRPLNESEINELYSENEHASITDVDGNTYSTVRIGNQVWMAENLKTIKYNNGDSIETTTLDISTQTTPKYQWAPDGNEDNIATYGRLYTWYAITDSRGVCPIGWHIPSDEEYHQMVLFLDPNANLEEQAESLIAGDKLKEEGTSHWHAPNGASNTSGFTALPSGRRAVDGLFYNMYEWGWLWSSTTYESNTSRAMTRILVYTNSECFRRDYLKKTGYSVRCVMDINPIALNFNVNDVSTIGGNDGSIDLTLTGGLPPYSYDWSNGATTEDINGLYAGVYTVIVTDSRDSTVTDSIRIYDTFIDGRDSTKYKALKIGDQIWMAENLKATTYNDGIAIPEVTDELTWAGFSTPAYCWYNNDRTTYGNIYGALYNWFTVETGNLCPTGWYVPTHAEWTTMENYLIANGYNYDGTTSGNKIAKALASDELWSSSTTIGAVGNTDYPDKRNVTGFTALPGGIRNGNGWFISIGDRGFWWSATKKGTYDTWNRDIIYNYSGVNWDEELRRCGLSVRCIKDTCDLISIELHGQNVSCYNGSDGSIDLIAMGSGTYTFSWSNGESTEDINSLTAGWYEVTVTDLAGCTISDSIQILQPTPLIADVVYSEDISCFGKSDGIAVVYASGGTKPYSYSWDDDSNTTDSLATDLSANIWCHVITTDANSCTSIDSVLLSEPPPLESSITDSLNISCFGYSDGEATITPSGGISPYTYLWDDAIGTTDSTVNGLKAMLYYHVIIGDNNGCTHMDSVLLLQPDPLVINITDSTNISCYDGSDGTATASVTGGTRPYLYNWDNPDQSTDSIAEGLDADIYYHVEVQDANVCPSVMDSIKLSQPPPLIVMIVINSSISCNGFSDGSIKIIPTGGTPPYTIEWNLPILSTDSIITGLSANITYSGKVTDSKGCTESFEFLLIQPDKLNIIGLVRDVSCFGLCDGMIEANVFGGTSPYTYQWSNPTAPDISILENVCAGVDTLTITDANGCIESKIFQVSQPDSFFLEKTVTDVKCYGDSSGALVVEVYGGTMPYKYVWSTGEESKDLENIPAGIYSVSVSDSNHCVISDTAIVTEPNPIQHSIVVDPILCYDGCSLFSTNITGGTPPYKLEILPPVDTCIPAGSYQITITDTSKCIDSFSFIVTEPSPIMAYLTATSSCFNDSTGSITANVTGGTLPYHYLWNNNANTASLIGVSKGVYEVTVTDNNACDTIVSGSVDEYPEIITGQITGQTNVNPAEVLIYSVNQQPTSIFSWHVTGGNIVSGQGSNVINVQWGPAGAGMVSVIETDVNGCMGDAIRMEVSILGTGIFNVDENALRIYPNPTNNEVIIELPNPEHAEYKIMITELTGKIIKSTTFTGSYHKIDLSSFQKGVYFITVRSRDQVWTEKIIKL